jgi:putative transcriptional regulator
MSITHVEPRDGALEALLAGYVAGSLSEPLNVLAASHLELSATNHAYVRALEHAAGAALEGAPAPASATDRDRRLAAIFALPRGGVPFRAAEPAPGRLPDALRRYLGTDFDGVAWKTVLPGVKQCRIADSDEGEAVLYWIRAGQKMPTHTHEGAEATLVIEGAFSDVDGRYGRGDVAIADQDVDHRPVAEAGEDCICFAVTDAPLRLTGPVGRWVQPFLRR